MKYRLDPLDQLLNPWLPRATVYVKPEPRAFKGKKPRLDVETGFEEALAMWNAKFDKPPKTPLADFESVLPFAEYFQSSDTLTLVAKVYPLECVARWIRTAPQIVPASAYDDSFRSCIFPFLSTAERDLLGDAVRQNPQLHPHTLTLAGLLGITEECFPVLPAYMSSAVSAAILGLPTERVRERKDSLTRCYHVDALLGLIAHTGLDYLEEVCDKLYANPGPAAAQMLRDVVQDPQAAPLLLPLLDHPSLAPPIRAWFDAMGAEAAEALRAHPWRVQSQKARKLRESALRFADVLEQRTSANAQVAVEHFDFGAAGKPPKWISIDELPPIVLRESGAALSAESTANLLALLAATGETPHPESVVQLKSKATPESLDRWAVSLMDRWCANGMKPKDRWALATVGVLGGPESVTRLTAHVASWAKGARYDTARVGYNCLLQAGSPEVHWSAIYEPALRGLSFAGQAAESAAQAQGTTVDILVERVMPALGFDVRGEREFRFGTRTLTLKASTEELRVLDEDRRVLPGLPKPRKTDDAALCKQQTAEFRELKLEYERAYRREVKRMERACLGGRKYPREHFERVILPHPLLGSLARSVIWGAYDAHNKRLVDFRVDEGGAYVDSRHNAVDLAEAVDHLRIVPNGELGRETAERWVALWMDYEVVQPFEQFNTLVSASGLPYPPKTLPANTMIEVARCLTDLNQTDCNRLYGWRTATEFLKPVSGGFLPSASFSMSRFEKALEDCLYERFSDTLAQRALLGGTVKLHFLHSPLVGFGWLLEIAGGPAVHDIVADDLKVLGLR